MKRSCLFVGIGFAVLFLIVGVVVVSTFISHYNQIVTLNENVDVSWAQVENQYQRRLDLIPNLVETVKGYATEEKEIFTQIAEARSRIGGAQSPEQRVQAEDQLGGFLGRLLMISENYPQLKANQNFMDLQKQLEGTENRISVERMRFNERVREYNLYIKRFPQRFYASVMGFEPKSFYEATEGAENAPKVDFSTE
jgi:LemA protein